MVQSNKNTRIAFIINPVSGTNTKDNIKGSIQDYFENKNFSVEIITTKKAGDASRFATQFVRENFDAVIAVGGDGTVNEVAKGLIGSDVAMGIIPSGSGNGFARHLGIPLKAKGALELIEQFFYTKVDVLKINEHISLNVSGLGFDAMVADKFQNSKSRGLKTYAKIIISEFSSYKPLSFNLTIDGQQTDREAFLISIANSSQFGNNAYISPEASVTDGLMDLCIVKKFAKIEAPIFAQKLMSGKIHKSKYIEIIRAKEVVITQESDIYHLDGDAMNNGKKLNIKLMESALNVIIDKDNISKI